MGIIMKLRLLLIIFIIVSVSVTVAADNSLWGKEMGDMYEDRPDFNSGDVITVIINENASAIQSANTDTEQSSEVKTDPGSGWLDIFKGFGFGYSDSNDAQGQTKRTGTLEASITTQVVEKMGNGNLKIEGEKEIKINNEKQIIKLSGLVRPEDINLNNEISSQKVAEASIEYNGQGPITHKQKSGWLGWLFGWLF